MIKTEKEYKECCEKIEKDKNLIQQQKAQLKKLDLSAAEIATALQPLQSFHQQLVDEVQWYERVRRREFGTINDLTSIGRILIALRIANGISQTELAERLGVHVSQVSRDESNDYHGVGLDRAQRILDALGERLVSTVDDKRTSVAS